MPKDDIINNLSRDDMKALLAECYLSTKVTAKILFPDRFHLPFSSLHDQIFQVLDDPSIQRAVILAPRGFGKTSTINLAYPAKNILFQDKRFIVPISNTATQAEMQSENLKNELLSNTLIKKMFEPIKSNVFSKEMWVTSTGTAVMPRGRGQQVRGILFGNHRPDLIVCDDLEDSESVKSEEQRKKVKEWFFADVCNSVNRSRSDWKIVVIGTLLHEDSLLMSLIDDPAWHTLIIDLCDDNYRSNWPDFMSDEAIRKLVDQYRHQGLLDVFYREYRNQPVSKETAKFKQEYFRYYLETDEEFLGKKKRLENIVICDPAKTVKPDSADTAIVGLGIDAKAPAVYVRDVVAGKMFPDQLYDEVFSMADRLRARVIGLKVTSLNEFITYPFRTEMVKRGRFYDLVEIKERASKEERVGSLVPFYRLGYVIHNRTCCDALEGQLMSYPRSKRWDIMDALADIVEMLEMGERYFSAPEEADKDIEDEYKELEDEFDQDERMPRMAGWRAI